MTAKVLMLALALCAAAITLCRAGELTALPAGGTVVPVDWQVPAQLPPPFRNHCRVELYSGRPYCENHCGGDYQFYFCSISFGCCHLGRGYCAWNGTLRCAP